MSASWKNFEHNKYYFKFTLGGNTSSSLLTPRVQVVYVGTTVSIMCESKLNPIWKRSGNKRISKNAIILNNFLIIPRIKISDQGKYICRGQLETDEIFHETAELLVAGNYTDAMHTCLNECNKMLAFSNKYHMNVYTIL